MSDARGNPTPMILSIQLSKSKGSPLLMDSPTEAL